MQQGHEMKRKLDQQAPLTVKTTKKTYNQKLQNIILTSYCALLLIYSIFHRLSSPTHQAIRVQKQLGMSKPEAFQIISEKQQMGMSRQQFLCRCNKKKGTLTVKS